MKKHTAHHLQQGYTLIELLLYVAIISVLLMSVTYFFGTVVDSRVKNQTIAEVNDQGQAVMDIITQTIRNSTSVTAPAITAGNTSLTLVVPTGALSPTIFDSTTTNLGYALDGGTTDTSDSAAINATKFTASATGTITTLFAYVNTVAASPNNLAQMAIYSGAASPTALLASSASTVLTANGWTAFTITPITVTSGQVYWLAYNTNGVASTDNDLRYHVGAANQSIFTGQTFGTWPNSWAGTGQSRELSLFAPIEVTGVSAAIRIKEGAGATVNLTSDDMVVTGLTFKNMTRSGTPGNIRVSFTLARVNASNRNEYEYRKTFTSSAEVKW